MQKIIFQFFNKFNHLEYILVKIVELKDFVDRDHKKVKHYNIKYLFKLC